MREIKLRAWDKVNKAMCEVKAIFFDIEVVRLYTEKGGEYELKFDDVVLIQFTGEMDRKCKECISSEEVGE